MQQQLQKRYWDYKMAMNRMQEEFAGREENQPVRLNKYLSEAGICSRREADRLIESGKVFVDGVSAKTGQKVFPSQNITVAGQRAAREKEMILLAVNKPRGIVCSSKNQGNDTTIEEFLHYPKRVYSVGRLDKDSEGLLLMTNNGELLNKMMRAGNYHEKEYEVEVDHSISDAFLKKMASGVYLKELDTSTRPCRVEKMGQRRFRIILTQGLNRQIRRMCQTFGYKVTKLKRVRIMNITLGNLPVGAYRKVTNDEMETLYEMVRKSRS